MSTAGIRAAATALALVVIAGCASVAPDYAREKRLADEIVPSIVAGGAVTLETGGGRKFLGLLTPAAKPRAALILVHGVGAHPDSGLIGELRAGLADRGYTTLSIQMPVLAADANAAGYPALFPEAGQRIAAAIDYLRGKGATKVAIVSHGMGARMVNDFIAHRPDAPLMAWVPVAISSGEFDSLAGAALSGIRHLRGKGSRRRCCKALRPIAPRCCAACTAPGRRWSTARTTTSRARARKSRRSSTSCSRRWQNRKPRPRCRARPVGPLNDRIFQTTSRLLLAVVLGQIVHDGGNVLGLHRRAERLDHLGDRGVPALAVEEGRIELDVVQAVAGGAVRLHLVQTRAPPSA